MSKDVNYKRLIQSPRWRELRNAYLSEHPCCAACEAQGRIVAARCVHHITPVETGRTQAEMATLCYNINNLQALCFECHAAIHKAERSHSREAVRQRQAERLERWKQAHAPKAGGSFLFEGGMTPKSTATSSN